MSEPFSMIDHPLLKPFFDELRAAQARDQRAKNPYNRLPLDLDFVCQPRA